MPLPVVRDLVDSLPPELTQHILGDTGDDTLWNVVFMDIHLSPHAVSALRGNYRDQIRETFNDPVVAFHETLPVTPAGAGRFHTPPVYDDETDDITRIIERDMLYRFRALVEVGLDLRAYSREGWKLLGLAIAFRSNNILDFLVDQLTQNDLVGHVHAGFHSPTYLTLCAQIGNPHAFERLVNRLQIDDLHIAQLAGELSRPGVYEMCRNFPLEKLKWACDRGMSLRNVTHPDTNGTVWHAAVTRGQPEMVDFLNDHVNDLIDNPDIDGYTPLFDAVELEASPGHGTEDELAVIKALLESGANANNTTQHGRTAVHIAVTVPGNGLEVARVLLNRFNIRTGAGTAAGTVLHGIVNGLQEAIEQGMLSDEATLRQNAMDLCLMVLEYEPDLFAENSVTQTASELAGWFGFMELAALMDGMVGLLPSEQA